jgi:ribosomal protein L20
MTKKENKKDFKRLLNEVIKAKVKSKELEPENFVEKLKAKKMLENMDDLF